VLVVPRPATRIALIVGFGALGQFAWGVLTLPLMAYVAGVAASFCLLCAGAIWAMRDKADMVSSGEHLSAQAFKQARRVSKSLRHRSTWRASWVAACALIAASPAISQQFAGAIWQWMIIGTGLGIGEAVYGFLLANAWEEQLRDRRDEAQLKVKELAERMQLISRLELPSNIPPVEKRGLIQMTGSSGLHYKPH